MLQKSKKIMSGVAWLSLLATFLFWEVIQSQYNDNISTDVQQTFSLNIVILCLALVIVMFFIALPGAFTIYRLSDVHFGIHGLIRWIIFGIVLGCLVQFLTLIPEISTEKDFLSFLIKKVILGGLGLVFMYISYFFAFKFLKRKKVYK